ncbi:MAG: nucleotidyltransferase family protein [Herminiimonas sp.]|nr:nucleotidyltransferase family protein [Herminiimonas sp.]
MSTRKIIGILLAAGRGRRFSPDGQHNKLLARLNSADSVLDASARNLRTAMDDVLAVVRPDSAAVVRSLEAAGCRITVCPDADEGMAASLVHALSQSMDCEGWVVALGDMPGVRPATIHALAEALRAGADIAVPVFHCKRGNPVAFSRKYLPELLALQGDQGARGLLRRCEVTEIAVDDAGILHDIDQPADLVTAPPDVMAP